MFRFKQPLSGSLPFVLCWSYNSQLKYIIKDGLAVWLHILCSVCVSCTVQNVTAQCKIHTQNVEYGSAVWLHVLHTHTKQGMDTICSHTAKPYSLFCVCIVHCAVTFCTVHDTHTEHRICSHTAKPSLMMYFNWLLQL